MEQSLHETHINLIKTEAILDFLFQQEKQQEQPQVPNSKDISKKLTLSAKEDGSILKRFFGHYEMVSTSEYYLLRAQAVLDFCEQLTLTEDFVQGDKAVLIQNARIQVAKVVGKVVEKIS